MAHHVTAHWSANSIGCIDELSSFDSAELTQNSEESSEETNTSKANDTIFRRMMDSRVVRAASMPFQSLGHITRVGSRSSVGSSSVSSLAGYLRKPSSTASSTTAVERETSNVSNIIVAEDSRKRQAGTETVGVGLLLQMYIHWRRFLKVGFTAVVLVCHIGLELWIVYTVQSGEAEAMVGDYPRREFVLGSTLSLNLPLLCWLVFEWMRTESSFAARQAGWLFLVCWIRAVVMATSGIKPDWYGLWMALWNLEMMKYGLMAISIWWRVSMAEQAFSSELKTVGGQQRCYADLIFKVMWAPLPAQLMMDVFYLLYLLNPDSLVKMELPINIVGIAVMACQIVSFSTMGWCVWQSFTGILEPLRNIPPELLGKKYLCAEVRWAGKVARRVQLALMLLCLGGGVHATIRLIIAMAPETRSSELGTRIALFDVPTNLYILFDFLTLLMIVGCFQSQTNPDTVRSKAAPSQQGGSTIASPQYHQTVEMLARRYITAKELLTFYSQLRSLKGEVGPYYIPDLHTMNDIVRVAIIPGSRVSSDQGVAYADLLQSQRKEAELQDQKEQDLQQQLQPPNRNGDARAPVGQHVVEDVLYAQRMVTHEWRNLFIHTVAAVLADALRQKEYGPIARELTSDAGIERMFQRLQRRQVEGLRYWICSFCVNQHRGICGSVALEPALDSPEYARYKANACDSATGERFGCCTCNEPKLWEGDECEMDKFEDLMSLLSSNNSTFRQVVVVDRNFDLFSRVWCVAELVEAHRLKVDQNVCLLWKNVIDANTGDVGTYLKLAMVSVKNCSAARSADKDRILNKVIKTSGIHEFDAQLQATIFGDGGLLGKQVVGFDVIYSAARAALRVKVAMDQSHLAQV